MTCVRLAVVSAALALSGCGFFLGGRNYPMPPLDVDSYKIPVTKSGWREYAGLTYKGPVESVALTKTVGGLVVAEVLAERPNGDGLCWQNGSATPCTFVHGVRSDAQAAAKKITFEAEAQALAAEQALARAREEAAERQRRDDEEESRRENEALFRQALIGTKEAIETATAETSARNAELHRLQEAADAANRRKQEAQQAEVAEQQRLKREKTAADARAAQQMAAYQQDAKRQHREALADDARQRAEAANASRAERKAVGSQYNEPACHVERESGSYAFDLSDEGNSLDATKSSLSSKAALRCQSSTGDTCSGRLDDDARQFTASDESCEERKWPMLSGPPKVTYVCKATITCAKGRVKHQGPGGATRQ